MLPAQVGSIMILLGITHRVHITAKWVQHLGLASESQRMLPAPFGKILIWRVKETRHKLPLTSSLVPAYLLNKEPVVHVMENASTLLPSVNKGSAREFTSCAQYPMS